MANASRERNQTDQTQFFNHSRIENLKADAGDSESTSSEAIELLPLDTDLFHITGERDFKNSYPSTTMITVDDPMAGAKCSGVLIGPRLALTAGHCVCSPRPLRTSKNGGQFIINSATCAKRAYAVTAIYGTARTTTLADMKVQIHKGSVKPHPDLKLLLDGENSVLSASADLAVILLDEAVENEFSEIPLAEDEAKANEPLVMVGFGYDKNVGGTPWTRSFRKTRVPKSVRLSDGRIPYEQQGSYVQAGYGGGPCFRETPDGRSLIGITSVKLGKNLSFTSTYFYRSWLHTEIQYAALKTRPEPLPQQQQ